MTIKAIQHSSQLPLVGPNFLLDHSLSPMVYPQSSFHPDPRWHVTCQSLPISNTYWSDMRPMCLDAPQCINPILNVSFGQVQQRAVWPNGYQASNTIPIDGSSTAFPFFAAGSSYYPHDIACPSSSCIPPMHDPAPSMSNYPFQPSSQSFHDIPAVSATIDMNFVPTTKNLATNEAKLQGPYNPLSEQTFGTLFQNGDLSQFQVGTGRSLYFEQVAQQSDNDNILTNITGGGCRAAQFTFQCPPPTQNTEPPVPDAPSGEIQLGTRKYFPLQRAPQQPEHNKRSHHQTHEQTSETAPTGPEVRLCSAQYDNSSHSLAQDTSTPAHICSAIPGSACNHGTAICLEILHLYVVENPGVLSNQKIGSLVTTATVLPLDSGQFVLGSRDDTSNDTIFSPHGATSQKVALLSSNTVASFLALSLPGRSCFSPLNTFGATAAFLSKRTASSSTSKKRQCTEDQECPRKQRRKCSMAMVRFPSLASHTCSPHRVQFPEANHR